MINDITEKACIFLVDGSYNSIIQIKSQLEEAGFRFFETFTNGSELLTRLNQKIPNLIISDICVPHIDGFQLLREIKSQSSFKNIPVILYSATFNDFETRKLAVELGANNFFTFPLNNDSFLNAVKKAVGSNAVNDLNNEQTSGSHFTGIKLIILEDDIFSSRFLIHVLKELDYKIFSAGTIAEFDELFDNNKPDICIIDYNLPDGDGINVLKKIKKYDKNIKVIMMTAISNERMIDDFIKDGADNFINKPINVRHLITAIKDAADSLKKNTLFSAAAEQCQTYYYKNIFKTDYKDFFTSVPMPLAIINSNLECLDYNNEFEFFFKNCAINPELIDIRNGLNLKDILSTEETENLKIILNEMNLKNDKKKIQFNFKGIHAENSNGINGLSANFIIKSAAFKGCTQAQIDNNIYYMAVY